MEQGGTYKGFLVAVIILLILIGFCLLNVETGTASFYLCIFSLIVDVPFLVFLLYKEFRNHKEIRK